MFQLVFLFFNGANKFLNSIDDFQLVIKKETVSVVTMAVVNSLVPYFTTTSCIQEVLHETIDKEMEGAIMV